MTLAILYICTGRYNQFFNGFYESSERFLLTSFKKHYFVWTDNDQLADGLHNVTIIHKECAGFPADTLFRFEMFLQMESKLKDFDYIYFFNSNSEIKRSIEENDFLPDDTGLAMGVWYGKREHQHPMYFPYERNKRSLAYVSPYGKDYTYFMGGINGGRAEVYLEMIRTLASNIRDDYNRGIIARFHDESHINAYLRHHPCKKLVREYCCPEEWQNDSFSPAVIFRNKTRIDPYFKKGIKYDMFSKLGRKLLLRYNALRWYMKL